MIKLEKIESISKILAALAIPFIVAIIGSQIQRGIAERNLSKEYVTLSISILTSKERVEPSIRAWAIDVLQQNSPVALSDSAIMALKKGNNLYVKESAEKSFKEEDFEQSALLFDEVTKKAPDNADALSKRGYSLLRTGKLKEALDAFNKAIQIEPNNDMFYYRRSLVYLEMKDIAKSKADLDKCLQLNPRQHAALNNRGMIKLSLRDTSGACEDFSTAARLGNKNADGNHSAHCR